MIHLFKHSKGKMKGKFDIALVNKGRFIFGSNQGYNKKSVAINAIRSILHSVGFGNPKHDCIYFQNDTLLKSALFYVSIGDKKVELASKQKLTRKYSPEWGTKQAV